MSYKITRSQLQNGTFVDKWYIKPDDAILCCDINIIQYFNCTNVEFKQVIKIFNGEISNYRSFFHSKESAEKAAAVLADKTMLKLLLVE